MSGSSFWKGGGKRKGPGRPVSSIVPIWHAMCQLDNKGNPISNLFNTCIALRNDPAWAGKLRYDRMLCAVVLADTSVEDIDAFLIHEWMQDNGLRRLGIDPVREAIEIVGREHSFHPLRDWLDPLVWDGSPRLAGWLHHCLGAEDNDYHAEIGQKFLIAMIARIYQPGCKADYMPVLEGPQRTLKSTVCRALAGERYFSDTLPDLSADHVRVSMQLRGHWLIEVAELDAFSRSDATRLKSFLSRQVEDYIPKFARAAVREPRQCLFIGTTNEEQYLRDSTGGSRFWPVKCHDIELSRLNSEREQLFAEARFLYQNGTPWWPETKFELSVIKPVQDDRYEADAWEHPISEWLAGKRQVTLHDLAYGALELKLDRIATRETRRLTTILRSLGWDTLKSTGGKRVWVRARTP